MKESRNLFLGAGAAVALAIIMVMSAAVTVAHAQTFTVLYNFGGVPGDPQYPQSGPIAQGRDGNLYATTERGGATGSGTIFRIMPCGVLTVVSDLGGANGNYPYSGLTLGRDGTFYGSTSDYTGEGWGTVFKVTRAGGLTVLYTFSGDMNGGHPMAPPIQGAEGNLYGTANGYNPPNWGTIYKITPPLHLTTMYQFTGGADGAFPGPLLQATDGNFYGTAGPDAFKISPAGFFTSLGALPGQSGHSLIQGSNGYLYGVTHSGGTYMAGTMFQMTRTGRMRVLHSFESASDGSMPMAGVVEATDGNFYGTTMMGGTSNDGTIYRVSPTGDFSVLYNFDWATGIYPQAELVQHTNGILYGEANNGGPFSAGVFFGIDIGAPPFVRLVTNFGKVGQTIGILGQGFTGATDVSFNGIPATFTVSSDTYLEAIVPAGATTGFVTVTTSTGTLTSNQQIQIRQ
jgi:uncharacterized repeat protein (TIGR03803 family)